MAVDGDAAFAEHRAMLLGLAYRLTGSMWDAEDVVQDAYVRWRRADRSDVEEPRAFLATIVSRLALDRLKASRTTREAYPGPWLPEPVDTSVLGPMDTAELRDTVAFATMHMLERLSPPERAVFVLREAFGLPYLDVSRMIGLTPNHCRQLLFRARQRVRAAPPQHRPTGAELEQLVGQFLDAARTGDLHGISKLLADDVVAWTDGGGRVRAALRPVHGKRSVVAFLGGLVRRYGLNEAGRLAINGQPGIYVLHNGVRQVVAFEISEGTIAGIFAVLNPDKLSWTP